MQEESISLLFGAEAEDLLNSPKLEAPDNDVLGARMMDSGTNDEKEESRQR